MVRHNGYGMKISTHVLLVIALKCVEIVIPWQSCRTIGPLTFHSQETKGRQCSLSKDRAMSH